jgi:UDP-N-acetylmuramate--alanine ligase
MISQSGSGSNIEKPAPGEPRTPRSAGEFRGRHIHLVGVGGCGMCGAARILQQSGAKVVGSDMKTFDLAGELTAAGAIIHVGHDAAHLQPGVDLVVRSAAVPDTNPEIQEAQRRGIPVIRYAELLGEITATRRGVSLAGTHGKSTTTALVAHMFRTAGLAPSFIVGADSRQLGGSSGVGTGPHFIVESCEYNRSFLHMRPHSAAILNIDTDHLDCYRDLDDIVSAFGDFAERVGPDGLLLVSHEDRLAKRAARNARCRVETFGFGPGADWRPRSPRANQGRYAFRLSYRGRDLAACQLQIAGKHNVSNALAAAALAHEAGAAPEHIAGAIGTYEGVQRRMTLRGVSHGVTIVDDYAHHPTEIRATLRAVRSRYEPKRTWVVFQPHQASRTRHLFDEFSRAFEDADFVLVPDIFICRDSEEDRLAMDSARLVDGMRQSGTDSRYVASLDDVCTYLVEHVREGDMVVTMGAGDVWKVADGLVQRVG